MAIITIQIRQLFPSIIADMKKAKELKKKNELTKEKKELFETMLDATKIGTIKKDVPDYIVNDLLTHILDYINENLTKEKNVNNISDQTKKEEFENHIQTLKDIKTELDTLNETVKTKTEAIKKEKNNLNTLEAEKRKISDKKYIKAKLDTEAKRNIEIENKKIEEAKNKADSEINKQKNVIAQAETDLTAAVTALKDKLFVSIPDILNDKDLLDAFDIKTAAKTRSAAPIKPEPPKVPAKISSEGAGFFFDETIEVKPQDESIGKPPNPPPPKPETGYKPLFNTREQKETVKYKSAETRKGVIEEKRTEANGKDVTDAVKNAMGSLVAKPVEKQNIEAIRTTLKKDDATINDEKRKEELEKSLKDIKTHDKKERLKNNPVLKARNISDVHEFVEAQVKVEISDVKKENISTKGDKALKDITTDSPVAVVKIGPTDKPETLLKVINTKALIINGDALLDTINGAEPTLLQKTAPAALKALGAMSDALSKTTIDRRFPHIHVCNLETGEKKNAEPTNQKHAQMLIKSSLYAFAKGMTPILGESEQMCIENYFRETKDAKAKYLLEALAIVKFDPKNAKDEEIIHAHEVFALNFLDKEHKDLYNDAAAKAHLPLKNARRESSASESASNPASSTQPAPATATGDPNPLAASNSAGGDTPPAGSAPSTPLNPTANIKDDPKYKKYVTMEKCNLPEGAIRQRMTMDGLKQQEQDAFFSNAAIEIPKSSGPTPGR